MVESFCLFSLHQGNRDKKADISAEGGVSGGCLAAVVIDLTSTGGVAAVSADSVPIIALQHKDKAVSTNFEAIGSIGGETCLTLTFFGGFVEEVPFEEVA